MSKSVDRRFRWEAFVAGWGAGLFTVTIVYPIHKTMFRQMLHGVPTSHAIAQLHKEGIKFLYRGLFPPLCQKTVCTSIMFGAYNNYGEILQRSFPSLNSQFAKSLGAGLSGVSEAVFAIPFERIQTLLQDTQYHKKLNNTYHTVSHIWKHHGIQEYYRGASMIVFRNSISTIMYFASIEKAQKMLPAPTNVWTKCIFDFTSGGLVGAAVSTLFYPFNVVKTRMQCRLGGPFESPHQVLRTLFSERGEKVSEMFRGIHLNYARSMIGWGITQTSYEFLKRYLYRFSGNGD